jgi:hypothetical protein
MIEINGIQILSNTIKGRSIRALSPYDTDRRADGSIHVERTSEDTRRIITLPLAALTDAEYSNLRNFVLGSGMASIFVYTDPAGGGWPVRIEGQRVVMAFRDAVRRAATLTLVTQGAYIPPPPSIAWLIGNDRGHNVSPTAPLDYDVSVAGRIIINNAPTHRTLVWAPDPLTVPDLAVQVFRAKFSGTGNAGEFGRVGLLLRDATDALSAQGHPAFKDQGEAGSIQPEHGRWWGGGHFQGAIMHNANNYHWGVTIPTGVTTGGEELEVECRISRTSVQVWCNGIQRASTGWPTVKMRQALANGYYFGIYAALATVQVRDVYTDLSPLPAFWTL